MEVETVTKSPFRNRIETCQKALSKSDATALVLFPSSNMYYLSGFEDEPMERHLLLFVTATDEQFVVPDLYANEVRHESVIDTVWTWSDDEDPVTVVEGVASDLGLSGGRVLIDDRMWAMFTHDLERVISDASWGLASEILADQRMVKDQAEFEKLRVVARKTDTVSETIRKLAGDAIGLTERELAEKIESHLVEEGCSGVAFEPIVGSGPNGANPHHRHSERTIRSGDPVVLDFGGWFDHYPGDQTRTVVFDGEPPDHFLNAHEAVGRALDAGVDAVEPGVRARDVDRAARSVIEERGFGDEFIHRTGHGVGLDVHEPPYIGETNDLKLRPGMVFSVEPGVYVDGEFGVRTEDLVIVTEDGSERLNHSPRHWRPL